MVKQINFLAIVLIVLGACSEQPTPTINFRTKHEPTINYDVPYEIGNWNHPNYSKAFKSNGNHRAVIEVEEPTDGNVQVTIPWRRRDDNPDQKDIIIVDATDNSVINHRYVLENNNEFGHIIFKPNKGSVTYYVYYFPHSSTGSYYPTLTYNTPTICDDNAWLSEIKSAKDQLAKLPKAKLISLQSIDDFHS